MRLRKGIIFIGIGLALVIGAGVYLCNRESPIIQVTQDKEHRCAACHEEVVGRWRRSSHRELACKVCHGPAGDHLMKEIEPRPRMLIKGPAHCLDCHLIPESEPIDGSVNNQLEEHLKAIEKKHVTVIDRARVGGRCVFCHEAH